MEESLLLGRAKVVKALSVEFETPSLVEESPGDTRCDSINVVREFARDLVGDGRRSQDGEGFGVGVLS